MRFILYSLLCIILFSCSEHRPPKGLIPPEDLEKILADIHVADAIAQSGNLRKIYSDVDSLHYSQKILGKYGYTQAQFDSTIAWYAGYPEEYDLLYEKVINRLSLEEGRLKILFEDSLRTSENINLWAGADSMFLPQDGGQNKIFFDVPLHGAGIYTISATIRIFPDDSAKGPKMTAWLYKAAKEEVNDSMKHFLPRTLIARVDSFIYYSICDTIRDTTYNYLAGYFLDHDPKPGMWKKHATLKNLKIRFKSLQDSLLPEENKKQGFRRLMRKLKPE